MLLKNRWDANAINNNNKTALYYAFKNSHMDIVNMLIDKCDNVNITNNNNDTLLIYAVKNDDIALANILFNNILLKN